MQPRAHKQKALALSKYHKVVKHDWFLRTIEIATNNQTATQQQQTAILFMVVSTTLDQVAQNRGRIPQLTRKGAVASRSIAQRVTS